MQTKIDVSNINLSKYFVPRNIQTKPFDLQDVIQPYNSGSDRLHNKRVSKSKQLEFLERVYENPFFAPYVLCIAGYPDDAQVKALALHIMNRAVSLNRGNSRPAWQNLYIGFDNPALKDGFRPSLLILSNLIADTSNQKIDKLRDCLEHHSNIPRIVLTAGTDPLTFFNSRVHYRLNSGIYLASNRVKKVNEL